MTARLPALALVVAALALASVVSPLLAAYGLGIALVALVVGPRWELDRAGQAAASVAAMTLGLLVPRLVMRGGYDQSIRLISEQAVLLAFPVLGVAVVRASMKQPRFGAPVTLAAGLVVLTAAGRAQPGWSYFLLSAAFLALSFLALALADPSRARPRWLRPRHWVVLVTAASLALSLAYGARRTLPPLQEDVMSRMMQRFRWYRTGFADRVALGSLQGLLQDDRVVMRVRGEPREVLLRGAVYSRYLGRVWEIPGDVPPPSVIETERLEPAGPGWIEIENAGRPERYFLPVNASHARTSSGTHTRDALGVHHPIRGFLAKRVWFQSAGGTSVLPPRAEDLVLPVELQRALQPLARDWGVASGPVAVRLSKIESKLGSDYRYSLSFERSPGKDPVWEFLTTQREGHCEYFASAMVAMARVSGVPARLVTGYRISERSPFGYSVVRGRHAHAWVEAWVDGRWKTYDPTPAAALELSSPQETPTLGALWDALRTGWEAADDWLAERSPFELAMSLVALVGGWLLYRNLRGRRESSAQLVVLELPLAGYAALEQALWRLGLGRAPGETLEQFAARLERWDGLAAERGRELAGLVRRYAELRYAERGDSALLDRALGEAAQRVQPRALGDLR
jgi:transglutaminase-like putative cysteine protease